jgi:serine/threonine protein kinase
MLRPIICPTCKKAPPAGVALCPNDGTVLPTQIITGKPPYSSAKIPASRPRPEIITGPELHRELNAMSTERLSPEHMRAMMQSEKNGLEADAFETQQMNLSHIASKLEFEMRPGLSVGEYIVEEKLGEGGMGEVWRARQPMIDKQVALKVLGQDIIANKSSLSRFLQEARAVNQIKHRNLVDIFSFGELPDGRPYFVMEFLDGKDLGVYLEQSGPLPFSEILQIFDQACRALQAAHERNIIHRDLKPDNIYLILEPNQPPFVKILDFGIAKLTGGDQKRLTHTNAVFGTPGYMAPEQCEGAKNVDHRADIYALAVILFETITGQSPYALPGESAFAVVARQMTTEPPLASEKIANRAIPPALDQFLLKSLSKKLEERPQSCTEFYQQLIVAIGDKKSETRSQMQEAGISGAEVTKIDIDLNSQALSVPKRQASKSQLEGLVGEVVEKAATPPKKDKKKALLWVGLAVPFLLGVLVVSFAFSSEAPKPPPITTPEPKPQPTSMPPSLPAASLATTQPTITLPIKTTKNSKTTKTPKDSNKEPNKDPKVPDNNTVKVPEKTPKLNCQNPTTNMDGKLVCQ